MRIACLQVCVHVHSDSANYWPGIHNTAFVVVSMGSVLTGTVLTLKTFLFLVQHRCVNIPLGYTSLDEIQLIIGIVAQRFYTRLGPMNTFRTSEFMFRRIHKDLHRLVQFFRMIHLLVTQSEQNSLNQSDDSLCE